MIFELNQKGFLLKKKEKEKDYNGSCCPTVWAQFLKKLYKYIRSEFSIPDNLNI